MHIKPTSYSELIVVAAHPDDEILMSGELIKAFCEHFIPVTVILFSIETQLLSPLISVPTSESLKLEKLEPSANYTDGFNQLLHTCPISYCTLNLPDQQFDKYSLCYVSDAITSHLAPMPDSLIITHHHADTNQDHTYVYQAASICFRRHLIQSTRLLGFVHGSTILGSFMPNTIYPVLTKDFAKLHMLSLYENQLRESPHPRALSSIAASLYFFGSLFGLPAGEPFQLF